MRGGLAELAAWAADGVRGEVTLVVEGRRRPRSRRHGPSHAGRAGAEEEAAGVPRKEAIARRGAARRAAQARGLRRVVAPRRPPDGTHPQPHGRRARP